MSGRTPHTPRDSEPENPAAPDGADPADPQPPQEGRATGIRSTSSGGAEESGRTSPAPLSDEQAWIGRVVDERYRIVEKLGEGGMGAVFVAEHLKLFKRVALKIILPDFAGDGELAARFAREAMASARLEHPHVASALDYGTLPEGGAYLVMQLVRGLPLDELADSEGAFAWPRACAIAAQVADALAVAHGEGIVHRDLKPENILVEQRDDGSELVKVLDFGIARVSAEGVGKQPEGAAPQRALTRLGTVMGTPGYMAPEQAVGEEVDHRADIYALGVIVWESIAGRALYEGNDLTAILTRQLSETPPALSQASGDTSIPAELEQLVASLLSRKPEDRPARANDVRDWLRNLALSAPGGPPVQVVPTGTHPASAGRFSSLQDPHSGSYPLGPGTGPQSPQTGEGTARTVLASHEQARSSQPAARSQGTPAPGSRGVPHVRIGGRSIPAPVLALGCAAPVLCASVGLALVMMLSGGEEGAGKSKTNDNGVEDIGRMLDPRGMAPSKPKTPPVVQTHIDTMLDSDSRRDRRKAAKWLENYEPQRKVPDFALAVAEFERSRGCRSRRDALEKIRDLGDERALPALERIDDKPRRGCGFLNMRDCYGCIRRPLSKTIDVLESEGKGESATEQKSGKTR